MGDEVCIECGEHAGYCQCAQNEPMSRPVVRRGKDVIKILDGNKITIVEGRKIEPGTDLSGTDLSGADLSGAESIAEPWRNGGLQMSG